MPLVYDHNGECLGWVDGEQIVPSWLHDGQAGGGQGVAGSVLVEEAAPPAEEPMQDEDNHPIELTLEMVERWVAEFDANQAALAGVGGEAQPELPQLVNMADIYQPPQQMLEPQLVNQEMANNVEMPAPVPQVDPGLAMRGHSSTIPHFGPVFTTERQIQARRETRPYVHQSCGMSFSHPREVKRHAKNCALGGAWDEHASCKVDMKDIKKRRCSDGYVVLDEESWNKLQQAEAAGIEYKKQQNANRRRAREKKEWQLAEYDLQKKAYTKMGMRDVVRPPWETPGRDYDRMVQNIRADPTYAPPTEQENGELQEKTGDNTDQEIAGNAAADPQGEFPTTHNDQAEDDEEGEACHLALSDGE